MINNSAPFAGPICTAVIGSMTISMKAQRLLAQKALRSEVIKISGAESGCIYGLRFQLSDLANARHIFSTEGITVKEYLR